MSTMSLQRLALRIHYVPSISSRFLSTSIPRLATNDRQHDTAPAWREIQKTKATGPHLTNTTLTIANEMPSVGKDSAPPELLSSVDPDFVPQDSVPENTECITGGTQAGGPKEGSNAELDVGEMEGAKFKIEPLRRTGEDGNTIRARLLCPFITSLCQTYRQIQTSIVIFFFVMI